MDRPVPAPAGLGDSLNVTALRGCPAAGPCGSLRLPAFPGKAEAASAPNHGPATLGLSSGRHPRVKSLTFQVSRSCTALSGSLCSPFLFFFSGLSLFLAPSCSLAHSAGSHPIWICSRAQCNLYFPPPFFFRNLEVLINNFEDFETPS